MDLINQQIENLNIRLKSNIKADKLLQKDWAKVEINKKEKKILRCKLSPYVKSGKANQQ